MFSKLKKMLINLKKKPTLESIYNNCHGNFKKFLEKNRYINNQTLLKSVRIELQNKELAEEEINQKNNQKLWEKWFEKRKLEESNIAERTTRAKETDNKAYALSVEAYQNLHIAISGSAITQPIQQASTSTSGNQQRPRPDFRYMTDINQLIREGVVSKEYIDKLKKRTQNSDPAIRSDAERDLSFIQRKDIHNSNKTCYSFISDQMKQEDKDAMHNYINIYAQDDITAKNARLSKYFNTIGVDVSKLNSEQRLVLGFSDYIAKEFQNDNARGLGLKK
jgi:hypothetical protein